MHLYVDADVLVYESAFSCQKTRYRVPALDTTFDNNKDYEAALKEFPLYKEMADDVGKRDALKAMKYLHPAEKILDVLDIDLLYKIASNKVRDVFNASGCNTYTLVLSSDSNFRKSVATIKEYKGNRKDTEKPVYYPEALEWFSNQASTVFSEDGHEADDYIGIWMTKRPGKGAIATIDKDLRMIPGNHYEWNKGLKFGVSRDLAMQWFLRQMLMGDTADNIPGIDGIGEVFAKQIVEEAKSLRDAADTIEQYYASQYGPTWPQAINEVARLLWILRHPDQANDEKLWATLYKGL